MQSDLKGKPPRKAKRLVGILAAAITLYLLLSIPEFGKRDFTSPERTPFAWKQAAFWSELEQQFREARAAGCESLAPRAQAALSETERLLTEISATRISSSDPRLQQLETNIFHLAPMVGACPSRLRDYATLVSRVRAQLKAQSRQWDLNKAADRHVLYRLVFGSRMALEEAMLQNPGEALGPLPAEGAAPSKGRTIELQGIKLYSGDILLSRGGAPTSSLIARGNDYPGSFSHVALLHIDEQSGEASVIESHIECGVAVASFAQYLKDKKLRIMAMRVRSDLPAIKNNASLPHEAATRALQEATTAHIPYDFTMNYRDRKARFCSEVVSAAYEQMGLHLWMGLSYISSPTVRAWLSSLGARHFETEEPSDLEYDPQLEVVGEWAEPAELFKAHTDDAVTDVMLEEAPPGEPLDYQHAMVPVTRIVKAYSYVLNSLGKTGPIPEGMTATTALRVKKYRHDHAAIAQRLAALTNEFKQSHGYVAPYWEMVKLAKRAREEVRD